MAITNAIIVAVDITIGIIIEIMTTTRVITITRPEPATMTGATTPVTNLATIADTTMVMIITTMAIIVPPLGTQAATIETAAVTRTVITTTANKPAFS